MTTATLPGLARGSAVFSPCGRYRYELHREWGNGPRLMCVGANPSIASEERNDATCRKIIGFAKRWGFGSLSLGNLFAYVSTDPAAMYAQADPVGAEKNERLVQMAMNSTAVWCAWGDIGLYRNRDREVFDLLRSDQRSPTFCIGVTKANSPLHPCRPGYASERMPYAGRQA